MIMIETVTDELQELRSRKSGVKDARLQTM